MTMAKSRANGPGVRAVIWVQGCTIGCPGCYNAFTHPHVKNQLRNPAILATWVNSIDGIEGVTFSGGEPFEQAEAIVATIEAINLSREIPISVFIFSGFKYSYLQSSGSPKVKRLLGLVDMLSTGPFLMEHCDTNLLWRGSSNQQLVYLSERYSQSEEEKWRQESPVEELVINDDVIQRTGFEGPRGKLVKAVEAIK